MKSLILKDLFNISRNSKSMLLILVIFAVIFIPSSGVEFYIPMSVISCGMMIGATFSIDDNCRWARYAMIMPISRKELVIGKFIVLTVFCAIGSLLRFVFGSIGGIIANKIVFSFVQIGELLFLAFAFWMISIVLTSTSIPLLFKFGSEKGRIILLISPFIPVGIFLGIFKLISRFEIESIDKIVFILLCCSPFLTLAWCYVMYQISYQIFKKKEL